MNNSKTDNFRPIEFWKAAILTLPDNAFFELVRTVFGKVKTPFNKQILAGDLEKFLLRNDIQKNIADYIDKHDAGIIAAVAFLDEPTLDDLGAFFSGELNYAELNEQLINLEERFILYRFQDTSKNQNVKRLALNPVFKPILSPFTANSSLLFPSIYVDEMPLDERPPDFHPAGASLSEKNPFDTILNDKNLQSPFIYDDRILAVLLSFVSMNENFFKAKGGGIRQKVLNSAKALFPGLPLEMLVSSMQVLGLLFVKEDQLIPDYRRFYDFGKLNRQERAEYYTASVFCHWEAAGSKESAVPAKGAPFPVISAYPLDDSISPWLLRAKVRFFAMFIHRFCKLLDVNRLYPFSSLQKLAYTIERGNNEFCLKKLIETIERTGLLVSASDKYWRKQSFAEPSAAEASLKDEASKTLIAMDASFSLMIYPEIGYSDLVKIAAFSHVTEASLNVRFELNRDSAVSAFNSGISADSIIELLQKLSQNRINENLIYTLRDWEKSHREVTLRQGLVLTLSPERRYLAETKPLSMLITETLAPGVYMLPETLEDRVVRALQKAGVSIIARHGSHSNENKFPDSKKPIDNFASNFYPTLRTIDFGSMSSRVSQKEKANEPAEGPPVSAAANALIEKFHAMLKKMRIDKEKQDELAARIDRRLILCESQLKDAVLRYEKLEARGLDYAGKTLIARQAINLQSLVEVTWTVKQKQERILGIPKTLEKTGSEAVLVIKPLDDEDDTIRVPLGKISLLRRIKRSIFETNID